MKKILLSLGSIVFASALLAGGTGAFLADSQTSTGNTFASGLVDLLIDNESYMTDQWGKLVSSSSTSWSLSRIPGKLFFNFGDVKPGDVGEDTISLHVNNNNAWTCMAIKDTATPENGQNEPEKLVDPTAGSNDGELQNYLYFVFWADDGDNVYEQGEKVFKQGLAKDIFNGNRWALADASANIWGSSGPMLGGQTYYVGKAWCFGTLSTTPLPQDGKGKTGTNGPLVRGTGITCTGANVGNVVQSDGLVADISFDTIQARNNNGFLCTGTSTDPGTTTMSTLFNENFNTCSRDEEHDTNNDKKWCHFGQGSNKSEYDYSSHGKKNSDDNDSPKVCTTADLDAGHKDRGADHTESLVTPSFSTTNYRAITLSYDRKTDDIDSPPNPVGPQTLTVDYSTNNGVSWTVLETVTGETAWTTKVWNLSPSADNKPNVKVRFTLVGQNNTNHAYVDNVTVTGVTP